MTPSGRCMYSELPEYCIPVPRTVCITSILQTWTLLDFQKLATNDLKSDVEYKLALLGEEKKIATALNTAFWANMGWIFFLEKGHDGFQIANFTRIFKTVNYLLYSKKMRLKEVFSIDAWKPACSPTND
jgi:hypothetical protein